MKIAYTMAPGRGDTDLLLLNLAQALAARGIKSGGTVQVNTEHDSHPCDMDVKVLPGGPILRISQNLGAASTGCRLDPSALEEAVSLVASSLTEATDLLIVNKFGKHEAEGRGFRTVIAEAIAMEIPVLVGLNALNLDAFLAFAGPDAKRLDPSASAILHWCDAVLDAKAICA